MREFTKCVSISILRFFVGVFAKLLNFQLRASFGFFELDYYLKGLKFDLIKRIMNSIYNVSYMVKLLIGCPWTHQGFFLFHLLSPLLFASTESLLFAITACINVFKAVSRYKLYDAFNRCLFCTIFSFFSCDFSFIHLFRSFGIRFR